MNTPAKLLFLVAVLFGGTSFATDRADLRKCIQSLATVGADKDLVSIEKLTGRLLKRLQDQDRGNATATAAAHASLQWLGASLQAAKKKSGEYLTVNVLPGPKDQGIEPLTAKAQAKLKLTFTDGKICDADGALFDTAGSSVAALSGHPRAILIMDSAGNFYASKYNEKGKFNHEVLARGGLVAFAGEIEVKDGVLTLINNMSGHYLPGTSFVMQAIESLRAQGAKFSKYELELGDFRPAGEPPGTPLVLHSPY